ncbi:MAG: hypothetical protein ABF260_03720 [Flavobacteriaceae bacterium]
MRKTILIFTLLLVGIGCSENNIEDEYTKEITFTTIGKGVLYGNGVEGIQESSLIILNQETWQNLINQMDTYSIVSDNFTETTINFETHTIVVAFGEITSDNSEIEITSITQSKKGIAISFSINESDIDDGEIIQPYHIVKIPTIEK